MSQDKPGWPAQVARPGGPPREHRAAHLLSTPATVGARGPEGHWAESPGSLVPSGTGRDRAAGGCPGPTKRQRHALEIPSETGDLVLACLAPIPRLRNQPAPLRGAQSPPVSLRWAAGEADSPRPPDDLDLIQQVYLNSGPWRLVQAQGHDPKWDP